MAINEDAPVIWEPEVSPNGDKPSEPTGKILVFDAKGNKFHLCAVLRKYTGSKLEFAMINRKRTSLIKISLDDLWDALGLLRSLRFDVEQYNSVVTSPPKDLSECKYRCFRLTRQAAAMGVRLPPTPEYTIRVDGLDSLIQHVESNFKEVKDAAAENLNSGLVDFESLAEYFQPGKYLVDHGVGTGISVDTVMRTRACFYSKSKSLFGVSTTFHLAMEVVVSTGSSQFAVVESQFTQSQFEGTRSIHSAIDMFTEPTEKQMKTLEARGVKYQDICSDKGGNMAQYNAGSFVPTSKGSLKGGSSRAGSYGHASRAGGRIMVDTQAAWFRGVHAALAAGVASDAVVGCLKTAADQRRAREHQQPQHADEYNTKSAISLDYHDELLLISKPLPPSLACMTWPVVPGFSLLSRVGKTLTAEAISELLHKPLYIVSMGELGTSPETLEERLQDILDLCVPWKALVLIDEAEMLLERRTKNDIVRNAMVCVMLRLLEYYSGILFLTTNRVEALDPAFQSRVTCALRYDPLSAESRKEIWQGALKRIGVEESGIQVDDLAKVEINGRQIKNALQLAMALAQDDNVPVTQEHLQTTLDVTTSFLDDAGSQDI